MMYSLPRPATAVLLVFCASAFAWGAAALPEAASGHPVAPQWPESEVRWVYLAADNVTVLSKYSFAWFESANFRAVGWDPADGSTTSMGFANFTAQRTVRYSSNVPGAPQQCICKAWPRVFLFDQGFNDCRIPSNYTYVGRRVVDGVECNGWRFIAVNYPNPAGNVMWTAVPEVDPLQRPVRMSILHNGRSIKYTYFAVPADPKYLSLQSKLCTSVAQPCQPY